jgi:hypothetical protein
MPDHGKPSPPDASELSGEFISLEGELARIRLSTGEIGILDCVDDSCDLSPGQKAVFRIVRRDGAQRAVLSLVKQEDPGALPAFDREVNQLHDALANHHPTNSYQQPQRDLIGEDRIQHWVNSVEQRLSALRKNRAKRLDEEFYNG